MNKILLLIGMWITLWFMFIVLQLIYTKEKNVKGDAMPIFLIAIIIATAITCIIGGIIL